MFSPRKRDILFFYSQDALYYIIPWQILKIPSCSYIFTFLASSYPHYYTLTRLSSAGILCALARNFLWLLFYSSGFAWGCSSFCWIKKLDSATVLYSKSTLTGCLAQKGPEDAYIRDRRSSSAIKKSIIPRTEHMPITYLLFLFMQKESSENCSYVQSILCRWGCTIKKIDNLY